MSHPDPTHDQENALEEDLELELDHPLSSFTLSIDMDNAAFQDNPHAELADCLREIAENIVDNSPAMTMEGNIKDSNGNTVGKWKLE